MIKLKGVECIYVGRISCPADYP